LNTWPRIVREVPAVAMAVAVGAALALSRLLMGASLGDKAPFLLAWPAIMIAAFLGGFWSAVAVGLVGLWVGQEAMTSAGAPGLRPIGLVIYAAFLLVFAAAGGMRKRSLRRAKLDAERLSEMRMRLAQVARLNAMGEMAGTLAHELNQPLTAIASYAGAAEHLARNGPADAAQVTDLLRKVSEQAVRAREIIGRIRSHVSGEGLDPTVQSLRDMFQDSIAVALAGQATSGPAVRYDFDAAADGVMADRIQVQQVMVNLVRNAAEAMRNTARPEITIGSRLAEGGLVQAYVADRGPGIAPDVAERLFEPFVSGKADGMGIGLSVSRSIVEAHGGKIWAEAGPGGGAVFRFTLTRPEAEAGR
jgi:two-component system sensor kinase FixL